MTSSRTHDRLILFTLLAVIQVVAIGCGESNQLETAPVSGRVTLNGEPVTSGYIYTSPKKGRLANSKIAEDGTFQLGTYGKADGASIGVHAVMLAPIPRDEGGNPEGAVVPPARYASPSSGLTIDVPPEGLTDHLIELEASPKELQRQPSRPMPFE